MDELSEVLAGYIAAWNALDFDALQEYWDHQEADIYYVAEEMEHALYDLQEVIKYWQLTAGVVESVAMTTADQRVKQIADNLAVLTYDMHMNASMRGAAENGYKPIGVDVRVSTIWKKSKQQWQLIHYVEAPLGALPFVRRAYNANAN